MNIASAWLACFRSLSGAAFDNVKASWNQALKLGDFSTRLRADYDYNANKDFINEVSLTGDLIEAAKSDDISVAYEVTHDFAAKNTNVKLTANAQGTNFGAEYDRADGFKEVSAHALRRTSIDVAPWVIVPGAEPRLSVAEVPPISS